MPVTIIVETGTGDVPTANSYVSVANARAYCDQRGIPFPSDDDVAGAQLIQGMDYLELYRPKYIGCEVLQDQPLSWPRNYFSPYGTSRTMLTGVAPAIVNALCELGSIVGSTPLFPDVSTPQVIEEAIGPIITKYSERNGVTSGTPYLPKVSSMLSPYIQGGIGLEGGLRVYRA